jgi:transposase
MFSIKPPTLQYWYKNYLSAYYPDIENNKWCSHKVETVEKTTVEIKEKPIYVFKEENLGANMSIDDKSIDHLGFTILSNNNTAKIALLVESTKAEEVEKAMEQFGDKLKKIENISMDMSPTYALVCNNLIPKATQIIDKFHVMQYVYDAVSEVKKRIKKELTATLTKGKKKTVEDKKVLSELELLRRVRYAITQSPDKWSDTMTKNVNLVFEKHNDLKIVYQISQNFKNWYDYKNHVISRTENTKKLHEWYEQANKIKEFQSVIKMIRKHEKEIINFFKNGLTNAKAERLNGKIQRFVSNNYGIKNKDFSIYRIANYFS